MDRKNNPLPEIFVTRGISRRSRRRKLGMTTLVALGAALLSLQTTTFTSAADTDPPDAYQYRDTQRLVDLVNSAARLVAQEGKAAFPKFLRKGSQWFYDQYYIFVYDPDGTCLFHPIEPQLVGTNMTSFRDMNDKPVIKLITQVGAQSASDRGWVFYLWPNSTELLPHWKSAFIRRVRGPDNQDYLVGSGAYDIKTERLFIKERVHMAANLLQTRGKEVAFARFRSRGTPFVFLGAYIFVLDMQGHTVFDPAYPTLKGRNVATFRDAVGAPAIDELLEKLQHSDEAWVQYVWRRPGDSLPTRKSLHGKKVKVGNETLIVGSDFRLATPIWMR